jgi:predicted ferric reductase
MSLTTPPPTQDIPEPTVPLTTAAMILSALFMGTLGAVLVLQAWLPELAQSMLGPDPKAFWYLSRAAGVISYLLLWLSVVLGLGVTNKMARVWPGGPAAVDLHEFAALLGLAFAAFHGLVLLGDRYMSFSLSQIVLPFATANYQPLWVGLGQIAFYLMIPVTFSFYLRKRIGYGLWRSLHYGSFVVKSLTTVHGLLAGSDTTNPGMLALYAITGGVVYFLTFYRIFSVWRPAQAGS